MNRSLINRMHVAQSSAGMFHVWIGDNQIFEDPSKSILHERNAGGLVDSHRYTANQKHEIKALFDKAEALNLEYA